MTKGKLQVGFMKYGLCQAMLLSGMIFMSCAHSPNTNDKAKATIQYDLGVNAMNQGNMRQALKELLKSVELDPNFADAHNALALVYHSIEKYDQALKHYQQAVSLKEDFSEAYNNMGILLTTMGRYDEAIAAFQTALNNILYPTPALAEGNMGWAYYLQGNTEEAVTHLRNAVAQSPKFCRGYAWLGRIGVEQKDPAQALANAKRFEKYCVDDKAVRGQLSNEIIREMKFYKGVGYLGQGDAEQAKVAFQECADLATDDDSAFASRCSAQLATLN